jgi:hypothetical protein
MIFCRLLFLHFLRFILHRKRNCGILFKCSLHLFISSIILILVTSQSQFFLMSFFAIIIFWEMTPCGSYKNRGFGGSYRLHLQGVRVRAGTERSSKLLYRQRHGVISQKMIIIIVTAVETSNLACFFAFTFRYSLSCYRWNSQRNKITSTT